MGVKVIVHYLKHLKTTAPSRKKRSRPIDLICVKESIVALALAVAAVAAAVVAAAAVVVVVVAICNLHPFLPPCLSFSQQRNPRRFDVADCPGSS